MKTFKTKKGTELPLLSLKGKDYLAVQWRVFWMREEHPSWRIETEYLFVDDQKAMAKAVIKDENNIILASAHKTETSKDFALGHAEKAETGAIGRALALCGYGTQFTEELDEQHRIVDSPVENKTSPMQEPVTKKAAIKAQPKTAGEMMTPHLIPQASSRPGDYVVSFGKYKGKTIKEIDYAGLQGYLKYLSQNGKPSSNSIELKSNFEAYWSGTKDNQDAPEIPNGASDWQKEPWPQDNDELPF